MHYSIRSVIADLEAQISDKREELFILRKLQLTTDKKNTAQLERISEALKAVKSEIAALKLLLKKFLG